MACLEQQLSFLINNNNWTKTTSKSDVLITLQITTNLIVATPQTSKKRVSVSLIISTRSFYNKLSINSPLVTHSATTTTTNITTYSTTTTTSSSSNSLTTTGHQPATSLVTAHHHFMQRNFSPMAALSRSPSCSSSPSVMIPSTVRRTLATTTTQQ